MSDARDGEEAGPDAAPPVDGASDAPLLPGGFRVGTLTCTVCFTGEKDHIAVPCGHQCACAGCASLLEGKPCPICRNPVAQWMKVRVA